MTPFSQQDLILDIEAQPDLTGTVVRESILNCALTSRLCNPGRNTIQKDLSFSLGNKVSHDVNIGFLGVSRLSDAWPEGYEFNLTYGVFDSLIKGVEKTWQVTVLSFEMMEKLVTGDISAKNLSGPVGIAQGAGNSASIGFVYFLSFIAFFSINLGIFNLLPIPGLDGGHIFLLVPEKLKGSPLSTEFRQKIQGMGMVLLLTLMVIVTINDLSGL